MQTMPNAEEQQQYGISRLLSFSDGVFGFAITLLIVNVIGAFPSLPSSAPDYRLIGALLGLGSSFFSYALSFYMVGVYWVAHHRMFSYIIHYTSTLLWLNLTLLLFVVFLPFSTSLLDKYNNYVIVAFYGATLTIISLCSTLLWEYAAFRHRLIPPDLDEKTIGYLRGRGWITLALFALSIGLAFLSPLLAKISWLAIFVIRPLLLSLLLKRTEL
ncbi:MAG: TMEM175 family protein [Ktedonobacteraceae bacterium]